jgi:sulfide:quinone oxidoreductase
MGSKVIVLGARFGGLTFAYNLKRFVGDLADIEVIERNDGTYLRPLIPHISIGVVDPEEIHVDLSHALPRKGIDWTRAEVLSINPRHNSVTVRTPEGEEVEKDYDYLLIAVGAHLAKQRIAGSEQFGYSLCEVEDALKLKEKLASFSGGTITIGSGAFYPGKSPKPGMPDNYLPAVESACEGPIFEMSLMLDGYLTKRGLRDKTKITVYSPGEFLSDLSITSRNTVRSLYKQLGYELVEKFVLKEFTKNEVVAEDGRRLKSDLSIYKPPYEGQPLLKKLAGDLADDGGFVPTDINMVSLKYDNIYCVGDANSASVIKLGYSAVRMAEIAAQHLANRLGVKVKIEKFVPAIYCIADNPLGGFGISVADDTLYGGSMSKAVPAPVNHFKKQLFKKYYMWTSGDMVLEKYFSGW